MKWYAVLYENCSNIRLCVRCFNGTRKQENEEKKERKLRANKNKTTTFIYSPPVGTQVHKQRAHNSKIIAFRNKVNEYYGNCIINGKITYCGGCGKGRKTENISVIS